MAQAKVRKIRDRGNSPHSNARVISRKSSDVSGGNVDVLKAANDYSTRTINDPFDYGNNVVHRALEILPPPFNPHALAKLPPQNNTLLQCLNALTTNIHLTGYTLPYIGPKGKEESAEALAEKARIESLLAMPDGKHTFKMVRRMLGMDYETCGYWFIEVGRSGTGAIAWFSHIPAVDVRLCRHDPEIQEVDRWLVRDGQYVKVTLDVQFRRAVHQRFGRKRYFKEFGDPRVINPQTGKEDPTLSPMEGATEFIYFGRYFPGHEYGLPRWINNIPAILGSREMEVCNLHFFYDNAIPALAVMVAGGSLTAESVTALEDMFTASKGRDSMNRVLVLEALPSDDMGGTEDNPPVPKIHLETLNKDRQADAMFAGYDKANGEKIQSSCQLPSLFIGRAADHSFAAAQSAMQVAENQVFSPDRSDFDDIFNMTVLSDDSKPPMYYAMRSNMARMSDPSSVMQALTALCANGTTTPNMGIQLANEMYGTTFPKFEEEWADLPFAMVMGMVETNLFQVSDQATNALTEINATLSKFKPKEPEPPKPGLKVGGKGKGKKPAPGTGAKPGQQPPATKPGKAGGGAPSQAGGGGKAKPGATKKPAPAPPAPKARVKTKKRFIRTR